MPFGEQRSHVSVPRFQVTHRPALDFLGIVAGGQQRRWLFRMQCHIELIQRQRQTLTNGLDVGFLARPAVKDASRRNCGGSFVARPLRSAKRSVRPVFSLQIIADMLDIDADLSAAHDGQHANPCECVRLKRSAVSPVSSARSGLPWVGVGETHLIGPSLQVAGEETQGTTAGDEVPAILVEMKPRGTLPFILRQAVLQPSQYRINAVQWDAPDVYLVRRQRRCVGRHLPIGMRLQERSPLPPDGVQRHGLIIADEASRFQQARPSDDVTGWPFHSSTVNL